jgi:biopolymer transport protein TolR
VCIIFLLITAVWTQISMIQLGSSVYGKKQESDQTPPPKEIDPQITVEVFIQSSGYIITMDKKKYTIAKTPSGEFDKKTLFEQLKAFKALHQDKKDAIVTMSDEMLYNDMIEGMDVVMQSGFPEVVVSTGG